MFTGRPHNNAETVGSGGPYRPIYLQTLFKHSTAETWARPLATYQISNVLQTATAAQAQKANSDTGAPATIQTPA